MSAAENKAVFLSYPPSSSAKPTADWRAPSSEGEESVMSEPGKAVFLSYASQDAEAAQRICDALRVAGVEVWLDQEGGLVGGDAWDRKIRLGDHTSLYLSEYG